MFFDRAFQYEVANRFQTIGELLGRLDTMMNPAASTDGDLGAFAAELGRNLRDRLRPIQLSEMRRGCSHFAERINAYMRNTNKKLQPRFQISKGGLPDSLLKKRPDVEKLVGEEILIVKVRDHGPGVFVPLCIFASGMQCGLHYCIVHSGGSNQLAMQQDWCDLHWFDYSSLPTVDEFTPHLDRVIKQALRLLDQQM